ncbi:hypothetical protein [Paenibacillus sp. Marseille-Q4541]|uniref:hypothetical protein n=1 Tax=Paenibacillus sp. Marseille-Q4541 TaxID=2831522 RepID=UPI001BADC13C|nr:hypothetical protein [Paenibacillus sp. Marseille-Q4541]
MKKSLSTDLDFFVECVAQSKVAVYDMTGKLVDYGGVIQKYSNKAVKLGDTYYFRDLYEFKAK